MDTLLVRERYKVVRVLDARENYAFVQAVDILDREQSACLLNIYDGPLLHTYLRSFDRMGACASFLGMFVEGESLVSVFEDCPGGIPIDRCFCRGAKFDWRDRLEYAEQLLHQALNMADLPAEVSCAAMFSENVLIREKNREIVFRFKVFPLEGMNGRELVYLAGDQLKKILLAQLSAPMEQLDFLDELDWGECRNIVQLYALWRERRAEIQAAYERLEERSFFRRWLTLLWDHAKRRMARPR